MAIKATRQKEPMGTVANVISGYAFKSAEFCESGIPVIKIKNIQLGEVDCTEMQCVPEKYLSIDSKYHVHKGDILISLTGSHINQPNSVVGRVARYKKEAPRALLNQRAGKVIIRRPEACDAGFLFYQLFDESVRRDIAAFAHGAANQANVSPSQIESLNIQLPPLLVQRKIAAILSVYDDLIDNNLRRIKILEEMAQNLYREWFVKFHFPGHQHARFVDSPLGRIPEGWEVATLGAVSTIIPGYAFRSKDWTDAGIPVIKIKNIRLGNLIDTEQVDHVPEGILSTTHKKYWLYNGDILIAMTGATAGKIGKLRSKEPVLLNQRVAKIDPKHPFEEFVWCTVSSPGADERFFALADGAAQPNMSGSQIENFQLLVPSSDLVQQFNDFVSPFIKEVDNMMLRNQALRRTRDRLLPKLISGEVDVSELDITVPEEVAA